MIGFWIILKYIFTYFFHNLLWILIRSVQEEMVNSLHTRISTVRYGLRNITARKRSNSCQKDPSKSREKKFDRRKTLVNLKKFFRKLLEVTRVTIAGRGRGLVRPLGPLNLWCGWVFTSTISYCIENDFSNHWLKIRFLIFFFIFRQYSCLVYIRCYVPIPLDVLINSVVMVITHWMGLNDWVIWWQLSTHSK